MIKPIHDRVLIKKITIEKKSKGGIFLGEINAEADVCYGIVLAKGAGKQVDSGGYIAMTVDVDDVVAFNDVTSKRINYDGEETFMVRESDIYGIIPKSDELTITNFKSEKLEKVESRRLDRI